jgi:hypothetical protein
MAADAAILETGQLEAQPATLAGTTVADAATLETGQLEARPVTRAVTMAADAARVGIGQVAALHETLVGTTTARTRPTARTIAGEMVRPGVGPSDAIELSDGL